MKMPKVSILIFTILNLLMSKASFAQNLYSIENSYQNGYIFPTNDFIRGNNFEKDTIDAFQMFSLKFSKQTVGKH